MYYPKSQIKPNLYTNGGEYILSTTKEDYKGYYYEVSTGQKYTGKSPQDSLNILLILPVLPLQELIQIPYPENSPIPQSITLQKIVNFNEVPTFLNPLPQRFLPLYNPTLPTEQDKQNGQFVRYFCKKTNENKYLEIDKDTYQKLQLQDPKIAWDLYNPSQIIWQIKGDKTQVYSTNKGSTAIIEQQRKWYGFTQWFQDKFLKYYLES
jgi:hypothetical protein